MKYPEPTTEEQLKVLTVLRKRGWYWSGHKDSSGIHVFSTVGLNYSFNHPELVITGELYDIAPFWRPAVREMRKWKRFSNCTLSTASMRPDLAMKPVCEEHIESYLPHAHWFYMHEKNKPSAVQICYLDVDKMMPWESGSGFEHLPQLYKTANQTSEVVRQEIN
jgi:hypothetical protein